MVNLTTTTPCISGIEVTFASFATVGKLEVQGTQVEVGQVPAASVGTLNGSVVAFTLTIESGHICVNVV